MRKINMNKNKRILCSIAYSVSAVLLGGGIGLVLCGLITQLYILRIGDLLQSAALRTALMMASGVVMVVIGGLIYFSLPEKVKEPQ